MLKSVANKLFSRRFILLIQTLLSSAREKDQKLLKRKFYLSFLNAGDIFYDVGANVGNRIEPLIGQGIDIVAIEPQKETAWVLKKRFGNRIHLVNKGLGAKEGSKEMFISETHTLSSFSMDYIDTTRESGRFSDHKWKGSEFIPITTLDQVIKEFGSPKFIKIDVEGFEYEVLKGLTEPVEYISIEYTVPERVENLVDCIKLIDGLSHDGAEFNYASGESMELCYDKWLNLTEMLDVVESENFISTLFGDVYSRIGTDS